MVSFARWASVTLNAEGFSVAAAAAASGFPAQPPAKAISAMHAAGIAVRANDGVLTWELRERTW